MKPVVRYRYSRVERGRAVVQKIVGWVKPARPPEVDVDLFYYKTPKGDRWRQLDEVFETPEAAVRAELETLRSIVTELKAGLAEYGAEVDALARASAQPVVVATLTQPAT